VLRIYQTVSLGTWVNKVMVHLANLLAMGNSGKLRDVSC